MAGNVPEQMLEALRKLLAEAKKLAASSPKKNEQLEACIDKAQALLDGGDISIDAVTQLTAELSALVKGAGGEDGKPAGSSVQKAAPAAAGRTAPAASAGTGPDKKADAAAPEVSNKPVQFTDVKPDDATTRGQLATFLYRNAGSPAVGDKSTFTDVPGDAYYAKPVAWVAAKGIAAGTGEGMFSPDTACTRGQIVTFLYRAK